MPKTLQATNLAVLGSWLRGFFLAWVQGGVPLLRSVVLPAFVGLQHVGGLRVLKVHGRGSRV